MMKKLMMCVLLLVAVAQAKAQTEVGRVSFVPQVGLNFSNNSQWKGKVGFTGGVAVDYQLTEKLALSSGASYSLLGYKIDGNYSIGRIGIPVTLGYYLADGLAVKAGLQATFKAHENDVAEMNSFLLGVPVSVSYEVSRVVFDARYIFNLSTEETKIHLTDGSLPQKASYSGWFQLTVGYRF